MKVGSLFSGIGGLDLGLARAGHEVAWQVEIDESCRKLLAGRFRSGADHKQRQPGEPQNQRPGLDPGRGEQAGGRIFADVREVGGHNLDPVDLICGGFPCQDLSVAGRRAGLAGERSGLFYDFMRIASELTPTWVLIENVPGLLSSNGGRDMGAVLGGLEELGYGWAYRVLNAEYFGVAQRRRRVFIVGCLGGSAGPARVLFEPESCDGDPPPSRSSWTEFAGPVAGGPSRSGRRTEDDPNLERGAYEISGALDTKAGTRMRPDLSCALVVGSLSTSQRGVPSTDEVAGGQLVSEVAATLNTGGNSGGFRSEPGEHVVGDGHSVRRLTPTECERLQGFPDGWTEGFSNSIRYRMIGNAVCVPVAEWIGRRFPE